MRFQLPSLVASFLSTSTQFGSARNNTGNAGRNLEMVETSMRFSPKALCYRWL